MSLLVESAPANRRGFTVAGRWRPRGWQRPLVVLLLRSERMATVRHRFRNRNGRMGWRVPFFISTYRLLVASEPGNDVPEPVRNKKAATSESAFSCSCNTRRRSLMAFYSLLVARRNLYFPLLLRHLGGEVSGDPQHYSHAAMLLAGVITFVGACWWGCCAIRSGVKS